MLFPLGISKCSRAINIRAGARVSGCLYTKCRALDVLSTDRRGLGERPFPPAFVSLCHNGLILAFDGSSSGSRAPLHLNHKHIWVALPPGFRLF